MASPDANAIYEAAMKLPPQERIDLADRLFASLDEAQQREIEAARIREAEDRLPAYRRGEIEAVDIDSN